MRLHGHPLSGNTYKVRLLLALPGRQATFVPVDIFAGENRTEDFLALNPIGQTPVLALAAGRVVSESNAILCFLSAGTRFRPVDPFQEARALAWMFFEQNQVMPAIAVARFVLRFLPEDHPMRASLPELQEKGHQALAALDRGLSGRRYLVGDALTVADIAVYGYGHTAAEAGIDPAGYPAVADWLECVAAEPGHVPLEEARAPAAAGAA